MKKYLTEDEFFEYFDIKKDTRSRWRKEGLQFIQKGRKRYYKDSDIEEFMDKDKFCNYRRDK